ncbi:MAG: redox-sensing transcriptional repressor Rex [Lachnospiraceae bacterium]
MKKEISQVVIKRMPRYYRYLGELLEQGIERISSKDLSDLMNVTASQIRQDLNNFGGFGQQGYGYNVPSLYEEIGKILGLDREHNMIVIGAGNLGLALASHASFDKQGFMVRGIFDIRPELNGKMVNNVSIMLMDDLEEFLKENKIDIAALTVPKEAALVSTNILVSVGIKAIWNFAQVDLEVPEDVLVQNVHLSDSLMRLSLNVIQRESKKNNVN